MTRGQTGHLESSLMIRRIAGCDIARALAIFGMVLVNFKIVMVAGQNGPKWLVFLAGSSKAGRPPRS